jgi:ABC-type lipoprotein release transport system permease subunit
MRRMSNVCSLTDGVHYIIIDVNNYLDMTAMTLVATVACGLPAWRASRLDPSVVLRDD